ncbi:hypothetical protein FRC12_003049 [Ceratobasidium sp. 428]|nr:hypothetical protein FRC12_003049 [Ceratobasidium sp. 428]
MLHDVLFDRGFIQLATVHAGEWCQENCIGDSGVVKSTTSDTPTYTTGPTTAPDPTPTLNCNNCTSAQCCTSSNSCADETLWYCKAKNGCKNCDTYSSLEPSQYSELHVPAGQSQPVWWKPVWNL